MKTFKPSSLFLSLPILRSVLSSILISLVFSSCAPFHWGAPEDSELASPRQHEPLKHTHETSVDLKASPSPLLSWPVRPSAHVTQEFKNSIIKRHDGIDIGDQMGAPIYAAHDGWVSYVGTDFRGYGRMILLETNVGWTTLYGHCKKILVAEGRRVYRGQKIALMGKTGNAEGVHLHFELMKNSKPVDPLQYLP